VAKSPEQVIAKLQRRLDNAGKHVIGVVDQLEGFRRMAKRLEDTLAYAWRQLEPLRDEEKAASNALEAIEHVIPARIRREKEKLNGD